MPALLSMLLFAFLLYCVLDVVLSDPSTVRNLPKLAWLVLIVLLPLIGGIAWLVAGRPETAGAAPGSRVAGGRAPGHRPPPGRRPAPGARPQTGGPRRPPAPRGPDDDPEFLRRLDEQLRRPGEDPPEERR